MRLDFRILWIDDQQKHVKSFSEGLQIKLQRIGFDLDVIPLETIENIEEKVEEHVHHDSIDLVLVDYDLGTKGDGGDQALMSIRRRLPHKEIVFYSATDTEKLRKIAYDAKVDGIYFSNRLSLVNDTMQIIERLLRRVLDIDHMRGVVMSATSDIDFLVEQSLLTVYAKSDSEKQQKLREEIATKLKNKLSDWTKDLEKAETKNELNSFVKLRHIFTAADKLNILTTAVSDWTDQNNDYLEKLRSYGVDVVPKRNKLAHVMLRRKDGRTTLVGSETWSLEEMKDLRCLLIDHRENFQHIAVLIDVPLD